MAIVTISDLTADEQLKLEFAKTRRGHNTMDLEEDTKYALVVLKLAGAVTQGDYAQLKADMIGVTGIQDVDLLIDHQTKAAVLANHTQVLSARADIVLRDDTLPE